MDRIILNKKNYKIWSALVMGKLEEANLEHTVPSNNTTTENTTEGEGTTTINEISARDDSKARRIIYKHLNEPMWEKVGDIDTAYELWNYLKAYDNDEEDEKPKKTTTSKKTTKSSSTNSAKTKTNKSTIVKSTTIKSTTIKSTTIKSTTIKSTSIKSTSVKPSPAKKSEDKEESRKDIEDIPPEDDKKSNDEKDNEKPKKTTTTKQSGKTTETRKSTVTKTTKSTVTKSTTIKSSSTKKPDGYIESDEENDDLPFEYDSVPYDEEEKGNETIVKASTTECDEENEENDDLPFEYDNVSYDKEGECTMDQTKYIINKLNKHNITGEKNNPYSDITDNDENKHKIDPTKFRSAVVRSAVGSLIHLARCTRPDISETISKLSTKRNNPTVKDWKMVQNVLKYLNKTRNYFLKFNDKEDITTYSDASFGPKDIDDNAKSTTGYIIYIGCAPICWKSKKQKFTARSTTEAEFNATADLIEKIMWLNNLNKEIEGKVLLCQVFCDNISNIKILTNEKRTNSSRHFDIDYSFVMDYIKEDFINMSYVSSNNMLADVLTKRVNKDSFEYFIDNTFFY